MDTQASEDRGKLELLRGRFRGRRGFIIGNGPSLRVEDLEMIHAREEISLACNKIFLIFKKTKWRPTAYMIEDKGVAQNSRNEIGEHFSGNVLYADYLADQIPETSRYAAFKLIDRVPPPKLPAFSNDLTNGVVCGGTVTYSMLQLAHWLGLSEVHLLGVDFNYSLPGLRPLPEHKGYNTYTPGTTQNYFAPDYIKAGEVHIAPDMESSLCAFRAAQLKASSSKQFRIRNATRGGKLEVFPRTDFDSLFIATLPARTDTSNITADRVLEEDPKEAKNSAGNQQKLVELTEAFFAQEIKKLRLYSFIDHLSSAKLLTSGPYAKASTGTVEIDAGHCRTIFLHPPARLTFNIPTESPGRLMFAVGMHPDVWTNPETGPCRFITRIDGVVADNRVIDVVRNLKDRRWHWVSLPVPSKKEGQHIIELETSGVESTSFRWAIWRAPVFTWMENKTGEDADLALG